MTDTIETAKTDTVALWKKLTGYAYTLEPLWVWWHNKVAANPKTAAISLVVLALLAIR